MSEGSECEWWVGGGSDQLLHIFKNVVAKFREGNGNKPKTTVKLFSMFTSAVLAGYPPKDPGDSGDPSKHNECCKDEPKDGEGAVGCTGIGGHCDGL